MAQPVNQITCSGIERTAPATMSHENHVRDTRHRRRAAAASRKHRPDILPRIGVSAFSVSPDRKSVSVSSANGQSSRPPTHQGGGASPIWRGTSAVRLRCAAKSSRASSKIHILFISVSPFTLARQGVMSGSIEDKFPCTRRAADSQVQTFLIIDLPDEEKIMTNIMEKIYKS